MIMQKSLNTKGLVLGIIFVFLGASVLPSISGHLANINTGSNNRNNSAMSLHSIAIVIGTIDLMSKNPPHEYIFTGKHGRAIVYSSFSRAWSVSPIHDVLFTYPVVKFKIGIVTNNFVCALFYMNV
jgi:hypothetical protein